MQRIDSQYCVPILESKMYHNTRFALFVSRLSTSFVGSLGTRTVCNRLRELAPMRDHATSDQNLCDPDLVRPDAPSLGGDDDVGELLGGEEAAEESEQVALLGAPITNDVRKDFSYLTGYFSTLLDILCESSLMVVPLEAVGLRGLRLVLHRDGPTAGGRHCVSDLKGRITKHVEC